VPNAQSAVAPQISIQVLNFAQSADTWEPMLDLVRLADRAGIDRLVLSDHILYGERLEAYADPSTGGSLGGKQPTTPDGHWLEPLTLLSLFAGITTRVRLGTAVLLAALRPGALLAKQLATLDVMSGGRVDLGVGVGWQREEYESCGLDFDTRGALLDHCLEVCQLLWTEQVVDHAYDGVRLDRIHSMPKPLQPGGVPIWVSGRLHPRTVRRVARFGVGWIPWGDDVADPRPGIVAMREGLAAAGRDPSTLQVQGSLPLVRTESGVDIEATVAAVPPLVAAGVTDLRVGRRWGADLAADAELLERLVPAFRAAVGRGSE